MIEDFLVPFFAVGLAELGDKTQLSVLLLSSKTDRHFSLLLGVVLAFMVVDGIAIAAGSWVTSVVSPSTLKAVSGVVFLVFGFLILRGGGVADASAMSLRNPFASGFALILLTELGDKTQIACALFATKYGAFMVFLGAVLSLALLSAAAVYLGRSISEKIDRKLMSKVAGGLFLLLGVLSLLL